jgi:hypothetical protein
VVQRSCTDRGVEQASPKRQRLHRSTGEVNVGRMSPFDIPDRERRTFDGWCDEEPDCPCRAAVQVLPKPLLYGLPCGRCKAYYDAELKTCPVCRRTERVSPTEFSAIVHPKARAA